MRVRLAAPPVDGKANQRLIRLLAKRLGVRQVDVAIIHGLSSREKVIEIAGLSSTELRVRLQSD